jgi:CRP-like cAMP-binding protein
MAIFSPHKTRTATVEVIEDSSVIVLLSFSILELRSSHPEILEKITEVIEEKSSLVEHVEFITCTLLSSIIN